MLKNYSRLAMVFLLGAIYSRADSRAVMEHIAYTIIQLCYQALHYGLECVTGVPFRVGNCISFHACFNYRDKANYSETNYYYQANNY